MEDWQDLDLFLYFPSDDNDMQICETVFGTKNHQRVCSYTHRQQFTELVTKDHNSIGIHCSNKAGLQVTRQSFMEVNQCFTVTARQHPRIPFSEDHFQVRDDNLF